MVEFDLIFFWKGYLNWNIERRLQILFPKWFFFKNTTLFSFLHRAIILICDNISNYKFDTIFTSIYDASSRLDECNCSMIPHVIVESISSLNKWKDQICALLLINSHMRKNLDITEYITSMYGLICLIYAFEFILSNI